MMNNTHTQLIDVIIPVLNEEASIGLVVQDIPSIVRHIVVVNNGSSDNSSLVAQREGAIVIDEPRPGYGFACLRGLHWIKQQSQAPEIVVFLDGDYSDYPEQLLELVAPIVSGEVQFVIGNRNNPRRQERSMTPQQVFGNWLATSLMRLLYGGKYSDLGPFRAIQYETLHSLEMQDTTYGWTIEMQLKVLRKRIPFTEVDVDYRPRIGVSKVSGTVKGTILAGYKILGWIFKFYFQR